MNLHIRNCQLVDGTGAPSRPADVHVRDGIIEDITPPGARVDDGGDTLDAEGRVLTPGFVDVHTHYDGQASWDDLLAPSSWHGVTTLVMGNCGVGFAPVRPDRHQYLIELMEGVEDIPGTALSEGMTWNWESFPEYLDALEALPRSVDIAAQLPHGALRAYVMDGRDKDNGVATARDLSQMESIVRESIEAGALALSTNRLPLHTSIHGEPVPGTFASEDELVALLRAFPKSDRVMLQAVPAGAMGEDLEAPEREVALYRRLSLETGCTVTFSLAQVQTAPKLWERILDLVDEACQEGAKIVPQVSGRPAGLLMSWETFHPFTDRPTYQSLAGLSPLEKLDRLRDREIRNAILGEGAHDQASMALMRNSYDTTFPLDEGPVYEPDPSHSIAERAIRAGVDPDTLVYDSMCDLAGDDASQPGFLHVLFAGYKGGDLSDIGEMMKHPRTVVSLADGGAHCSMICDASMPTYLLKHWVRDRTRGPKLPIEDAVRMLTADPAKLYGFDDRGVVAKGKRADLNLIDMAALDLASPEIAHDLPTGAARIVQRGSGIVATILQGQITFRDGVDTGARPGRLVRNPRV